MIRALARRLGIVAIVGLLFCAAIPVRNKPPTIRIGEQRRLSFNEHWRFHKGESQGAEGPAFDDSQWTEVRLPHDWAIAGPFDPNLNPHTGALPISGTGWYRKSFRLSDDDKRRYFSIAFDGVMSNSTVWLNGKELGGRPYGYASFAFDLTQYLHFGNAENVLAVRVAPEEHSSRWYPGAGIYRNVWLDVTGPVRVAHWGTYVTTPEVSPEQATVSVKTQVENRQPDDTKVELRSSILDQSGIVVGKIVSPASAVLSGGTQTFSGSLTLRKPHRWDVDEPYLYTLVSEVVESGHVLDRFSTTFGVRTIAFDRGKGFLLNGRSLKLHGVCMHHDLGALGAAVNRRATERQLEILKVAGVNAVRTSHNPPSPELLEACDRLGLLVMDEAFDMWRIAKVPNGYSKYYDQWSERDLRDMVRRDRNHPSIILWSIGNEIPEQKTADGWKEAQRLTDFFHEEDPTRPTTSGFNEWDDAIRNHMAEHVDVPGFNYKPMRYEQILKEHPTWVIFGSETSSCVSSRGVYQLPIQKYEKDPSLQLNSYDIIAPPWAYCPDVEFTYQDRFPNVLGEFVWTGFDYIGEPTPFFGWDTDNSHDWPARSSYFGMVDLAGFPKDRFYLYQSQWTSKPMVHVLPHWNWNGHEGQNIPVMAYTNADEVELFLNGTSLGKKKRSAEAVDIPVGPNVSSGLKFSSKYRMVWQVPYQSGELKAVAYSHGTEVDNFVQFSVTGVGDIAAVDNGNAATVESFQADHRKAFSGMALLIVRSKNESGKIHVVATSTGLAAGDAVITSGPTEQAKSQ